MLNADDGLHPLRRVQAGLPAPRSPGDWHVLFNAIKRRLRGELTGKQHPQWDAQVEIWMGQLAQDCEAALDQLSAALEQEYARRRQGVDANSPRPRPCPLGPVCNAHQTRPD